jgi:hypothetical protein
MPERFLTLCHWGCAIMSHLDYIHDRVYRGEPGRDDTYILDLEANSLFEWLDRWAKGEVNFFLKDGNYLTREEIAEEMERQEAESFETMMKQWEEQIAGLSKEQRDHIRNLASSLGEAGQHIPFIGQVPSLLAQLETRLEKMKAFQWVCWRLS